MNELSVITWATLISATLLSSVLSVSMGAGGNFIRKYGDNSTLPVVVPLHACVLFLGNINQWLVLKKYFEYRALFKSRGISVTSGNGLEQSVHP